MFEFLFNYPPRLFAESRLVFLTRLPVEAVLLLALLAAGLMWLLYRRAGARIAPRPRRAALILRMVLAALVVFLLAAPALSTAKPRKHGIYTAVLVDTSRSMSIADMPSAKGDATTRLDAALAVLNSPQGVLPSLTDQCQTLVYGFDRQLQRATDLRQLRAEGRLTNLFRSVRELEEDLRGLPVASVVLLTDGCRNDGGTADDAARILAARQIPLHVVGLGDPQPPKDLEVARVLAPRRVRRNSEVDVYATIRHPGFTQPFEVSIVREKTTLLQQRVTPQAGSDIQRLRLVFTPDMEGAATYRVVIAADPAERLKDNNAAEFTIDMQDDRLPVLYVEGSPRTEYRYLRRALFRDKDFRLVSVLRLSSTSPEAAGAGSRSRATGEKLGFYVQGANVSESFLEKGFPTTAEQLFAFQTLILGDIEAGFFTPAQLALIEQFVRTRGGGLLMLGGVNSFGLGKYGGTPVEKMLPVTISPADPPYSDETFKARATPEALTPGNPHLLMRLTQDEGLNRRVWEQAQPLIGLTPVRGLKLGATPLLVHEKTSQPVLAVHGYGQGRVAAFTSGGSWYWRMNMPISQEFHERFWKQVVRWLVVGVKERLAVETTSAVYARGEPVAIRATILGKDLQPVNDANAIATITDPLGNTTEVPLDWILSEEGVYQGAHVPAEEGDYKLAVRVEGRTGDGGASGGASGGGGGGGGGGEDWKQVKAAETEFRVSEPLVEFNDAAQKQDVLRQMASLTGGWYYEPGQTGELVIKLKQAVQSARQTGSEYTRAPLWDMPALFGLILLLAGTEWLVRRKAGLA